MRRAARLALVLMLVAAAAPVRAQDSSTETGISSRSTKDRTDSQRISIDDRTTEGERESESEARATEVGSSRSVRAVADRMRSSSADVTLDLAALFLGRLAELERRGDLPWGACRVLVSPNLAADVGLSADLGGGWVNAGRASALPQAAASNMPISEAGGSEVAVWRVRDCLARYGAFIAEAYGLLIEDLAALEASGRTTGHDLAVRGLGQADVAGLAAAALERAAAGELADPTARRLLAAATVPRVPCRFAGAVDRIQCGSAMLTLAVPPSLVVDGVELFGRTFAGRSGTVRVSSGWSWRDAVESVASTSSYSKWAQEVASYAEQLESRGRAREAVRVRREAWEWARAGRNTVSPGALVAGR